MTNNRGISGVVMAIIMIALVLVAAGIFWVVVGNLLDKESKGIGVSNQCLGIDVKPTSLDCDGSAAEGYNCSVRLERGSMSTSEEFSGVAFTFSNSSDSSNESYYSDGNVGTVKTITFNDVRTTANSKLNATRVDVRVYMTEDGEKSYCSAVSKFPAA